MSCPFTQSVSESQQGLLKLAVQFAPTPAQAGGGAGGGAGAAQRRTVQEHRRSTHTVNQTRALLTDGVIVTKLQQAHWVGAPRGGSCKADAATDRLIAFINNYSTWFLALLQPLFEHTEVLTHMHGRQKVFVIAGQRIGVADGLVCTHDHLPPLLIGWPLLGRGWRKIGFEMHRSHPQPPQPHQEQSRVCIVVQH